MGKRFVAMLAAMVLAVSLLLPAAAFAADAGSEAAASRAEQAGAQNAIADVDDVAAREAVSHAADACAVLVSAEGEAACIDGASFAAADFSRAQRGSNRDVDGVYIGYSYYMGSSPDKAVAVATETDVVVYVPAASSAYASADDAQACADLKAYFIALDAAANNAGIVVSDAQTWHFTSDESYVLGDTVLRFGVEGSEGRYYVTVLGSDGSDVVSANEAARPTHVDFFEIADPAAVNIVAPSTGLAAIEKFFSELDWSPLWVSLKTTGVAIVFIFILGLAAAYFCQRIPKRVQDVADAIFTIPMVLPPTVCGFLLLWLLGNASPTGQWLRSMGIELTFTWPATVVAAVVVAFPLMYRTARGAFEGLDPNMLDAARTLGWSNVKIFFKLMVPLAWSSIAAGTVLAFARALGEFGATLFVAGNHAGITTTLPIAIYFEWMGGNDAAAWFWAGVIIAFSFIVIVFVNLWSRRTTKYRRRNEE